MVLERPNRRTVREPWIQLVFFFCRLVPSAVFTRFVTSQWHTFCFIQTHFLLSLFIGHIPEIYMSPPHVMLMSVRKPQLGTTDNGVLRAMRASRAPTSRPSDSMSPPHRPSGPTPNGILAVTVHWPRSPPSGDSCDCVLPMVTSQSQKNLNRLPGEGAASESASIVV